MSTTVVWHRNGISGDGSAVIYRNGVRAETQGLWEMLSIVDEKKERPNDSLQLNGGSGTIRLDCGCGEDPLKIVVSESWRIDLRGEWHFTHSCGRVMVLPRDINGGRDSLPDF